VPLFGPYCGMGGEGREASRMFGVVMGGAAVPRNSAMQACLGWERGWGVVIAYFFAILELCANRKLGIQHQIKLPLGIQHQIKLPLGIQHQIKLPLSAPAPSVKVCTTLESLRSVTP
jgi:hypothetical protein